MKPIAFFKMSGSGNDFIIVDNRENIININEISVFIRQICRRRLSVGADGFILIEPSENADFRWRFFNSDGSKAEMCGNGARCAARFAYVKGIAGDNLSFETDAGIVSGEIIDDRVKVKMPDPVDLFLDEIIELESGPIRFCKVNTGVPHVVVMTEGVEDIDVMDLGREIRFHEAFAPAGTNVNFICEQKPGQLTIRTYERGVENETLACGTGCIAAAITTSCKMNWRSPIYLLTRSGEFLTIHFTKSEHIFKDIYLEGDARIIYTAELGEDAWKS